MQAFIAELKPHDNLITKINDRLWYSLADHGTAERSGTVRFQFKYGSVVVVSQAAGSLGS